MYIEIDVNKLPLLMKSAVERASESTWKSLNWCFNIYGDHVFTLYKINVFFHVATLLDPYPVLAAALGPTVCPCRIAWHPKSVLAAALGLEIVLS